VWKAVDIATNITTLSMYLIRRALLIEPVFIKNITWRRGSELRTETGLQATVL
jgi:hypothetical protein